jgi:hypothetical protein
MRSLVSYALAFLCAGVASAHADTKVGLRCNLEGTGINGEWHIAYDMERSLYSARIGNKVLKRNQPAELMTGFGPAGLSVEGIKLVVQLSTNQYWLIIKEDQAYTSAFSGSFTKPVGKCSDERYESF